MFLNNYTAGPIVEPIMRVSILSSRDTHPNILFTLSFNVTFGPPSRVLCYHSSDSNAFINNRYHPNLSREVIRSQYTDSKPDITRITVTVDQPIREGRMYRCEIVVEGRVGIVSGTYNYATKGSIRSTNATVTGG